MSFEYQRTRYCDLTPARKCRGYCQVWRPAGEAAAVLAGSVGSLDRAGFGAAGRPMDPSRWCAQHLAACLLPFSQEHFALARGAPAPESAPLQEEAEGSAPPPGASGRAADVSEQAAAAAAAPLRSRRYADSTPARILDSRDWQGVSCCRICGGGMATAPCCLHSVSKPLCIAWPFPHSVPPARCICRWCNTRCCGRTSRWRRRRGCRSARWTTTPTPLSCCRRMRARSSHPSSTMRCGSCFSATAACCVAGAPALPAAAAPGWVAGGPALPAAAAPNWVAGGPAAPLPPTTWHQLRLRVAQARPEEFVTLPPEDVDETRADQEIQPAVGAPSCSAAAASTRVQRGRAMPCHTPPCRVDGF